MFAPKKRTHKEPTEIDVIVETYNNIDMYDYTILYIYIYIYVIIFINIYIYI